MSSPMSHRHPKRGTWGLRGRCSRKPARRNIEARSEKHVVTQSPGGHITSLPPLVAFSECFHKLYRTIKSESLGRSALPHVPTLSYIGTFSRLEGSLAQGDHGERTSHLAAWSYAIWITIRNPIFARFVVGLGSRNKTLHLSLAYRAEPLFPALKHRRKGRALKRYSYTPSCSIRLH